MYSRLLLPRHSDLEGFDARRALDVFVSHFTKLIPRLGVADLAGVLPTFVGLITQIDGATRHRAAFCSTTQAPKPLESPAQIAQK